MKFKELWQKNSRNYKVILCWGDGCIEFADRFYSCRIYSVYWNICMILCEMAKKICQHVEEKYYEPGAEKMCYWSFTINCMREFLTCGRGSHFDADWHFQSLNCIKILHFNNPFGETPMALRNAGERVPEL